MKLFDQGMSRQEFADRWEASKDKMYRFAYCYVKNEHDAFEILSEATCKAYTSLSQLREPDYFDTWMGQIIIRSALDFLKKQKRFVAEEEIEQEPVKTDNQIDEFEQAEIRLDVYAALELILPEERSYIILKYFEDKSFLEIARIMGLPEATVKTKVYRSLKKMRKYWKDSEE